MKDQIKYTEDVLFDHYMISANGEEHVHSQIPFFIEEDIWDKMKYYGEEINRIAISLLGEINGLHKELLNYFDEFSYKDKIFSLKAPLAPMYWTRFDTFIDKNNRVYFSEFNYDKPCGQKEIHLAEKCDFKGNLNEDFIEDILKRLIEISEDFSEEKGNINVGFLMDSCHYEELHHSLYFKEMLKDTKINIIPVGNSNLSVKDGFVYGFSKVKLHVILKLFPTEFSNEIDNFEEILSVFNEGRVLLINDPRIIAIQAKGLFAYLWKLVKSDSSKLSYHDKEIVRKCLPYTEILTLENKERVLRDKDKYVIKSSLGRYSQEVYIGKLYNQKAWEEQVARVFESKKIHIVQDLILVREEYTYAPDYDNKNTPMKAYGNYGLYIMDKDVRGILVRWGLDILTDDYKTWMSPLGKDNYPLKIEKSYVENHEKVYEKLSEELAFNYDFTGAYTGVNEYISLDRMVMDKKCYEEMKWASYKFCSILNKIYPKIINNLELFGDILGIPKELYSLVRSKEVTELCAVGRIDFAFDNFGNMKILEFNSETPAGLVESMYVPSILKDTLSIKYENPNKFFRDNLKDELKTILSQFNRKIENIAVVTSWYYEDIYNTKVIAEVLRECGNYNIIFGNVYDMDTDGNDIYIYGKKIDAIYRYYPLDWFYYDEDMKKFINPLSKKEYLINPGHTLATQSKAFFAVMYELLGKGILSSEEENFIINYIPYTTLEKDRKLSTDYLAKPYLSREGQGIKDGFESLDKDEEYIFQDRINIRPLRMDVYSSLNKKEMFQFPIIGMYIASAKPVGVYTRMGEFVTNSTAKYISLYLK
ncbi:Glutathionylspermidine synthase [Clostridium sp. DSM 8431]|uniref:glutathionylspermidine synthase family protein n=1 Tax=Clostridium sp. DSM 8431 TaxID=1761781 RepID=UPI0008F0F901|nr:glutathionylspermidine synthase family protein [Clostridium sp. DSM 8431]SFU69585.1 Glutathionylspermidine synthase [Clostridium sp. DSM 8431]